MLQFVIIVRTIFFQVLLYTCAVSLPRAELCKHAGAYEGVHCIFTSVQSPVQASMCQCHGKPLLQELLTRTQSGTSKTISAFLDTASDRNTGYLSSS